MHLIYLNLVDAHRGGIAWRAKVQGPDIYDGTIKFTQLIAIDKALRIDVTVPDKIIPVDQDGWAHKRGTYGLDTQIAYGGLTWPLAQNATITKGQGDSPSIGIRAKWGLDLIDNDQFVQYCMWKPSGTNSIYVAIGRLTWGCRGSVTRGGIYDSWSVVTGGATPPNPSGAAYSGPPPEWSQTWDSNTPYSPGP